MILDELSNLGYVDVRPLDKLGYTNGFTYTFPKDTYFTCREENDVALSIFNFKLEKLVRMGKDIVNLRCTEAVATRPATHLTNEWIERRIPRSYTTNGFQSFNVKKIRAAIDAADANIKITEKCGIVPVFIYAAPQSEVSHYKIEMKIMRDRLIATNKIKIENLIEEWQTIVCAPGISAASKWTPDHDKVLEMYQIRNTDSAIRNKETGNIIGSKTRSLSGVINGKVIKFGIYRYRAYMFTFMRDTKRGHQTEIDHIDGDDTNNSPWNLRWVSKAENGLAKHVERTERDEPDTETLVATHGPPANPKEWNMWTFHSNMWILRANKKKIIARAEFDKYPMIGVTVEESGMIRTSLIRCHLLVAYLYRIPTSQLASVHLEMSEKKSRAHFDTYGSTFFEYSTELKKYDFVIMHLDNIKSNYNVNNLMIGTRSENMLARHDNPETTSRKRVDVIDLETGKRFKSFESYTAAAEWFGINRNMISQAVRFNRGREFGTYGVTTNKISGVRYVVVECMTS